MTTARTLCALALVGALIVPGCGSPPPAKTIVGKQDSTVPDGCLQYGFAKTYLYPPEGDSHCTKTGPNDPQMSIQMSLFFLCERDPSGYPASLTYQYSWFHCLSGGDWVGDPQPQTQTWLECPSWFGEPEGDCQMRSLPDDPLQIDATSPTGMLLRALVRQINDTRDKIKAEGGSSTQDERLRLLDAAQLFADISDTAFYRGWQQLGMHSVSVGWRVVDMAVNFVPGAALVRDSIIVLTGTNPITGEMVSDTERAMIAAALLVPTFLEGAAHVLVDLGETLGDVARSGKAEATAAQDLLGAISRADEEAVDLVHSLPCTTSRLGSGKQAPLGAVPCGKIGAATAQLASEAEDVLARLRNQEVSFGAAKTNNYQNTFFDSFGWELKEDVGQVHHAVPQSVLKDYPGVISEAEMHSLENLRGIPLGPDGTDLHQSKIATAWNDFFKGYQDQGRIPTREELLSYALEIDNMYGSLFVPPIR